jgi:hypothetical protein
MKSGTRLFGYIWLYSGVSGTFFMIRTTRTTFLRPFFFQIFFFKSCVLSGTENIVYGAVERIFEPGFTAKENSRGMGLTVARNLLRRVGGDISLVRDRRRRGWTTFEITLKTKKPRLTSYEY